MWFGGVGTALARFSRVDSCVARSPRVYFQRVCVSRGLNCRIAEPASKRCARSLGCTDRAGVVGGLSFLAATFQQFTFHKVFRCLKRFQKHAQRMFLGCTSCMEGHRRCDAAMAIPSPQKHGIPVLPQKKTEPSARPSIRCTALRLLAHCLQCMYK